MLLAAALLFAVQTALPAPSGPYPIGRITRLIEDPTRIEPLDPALGPRRILVDVWYPAAAQPSATPARYLDVPAIEAAIGAKALKQQLGNAIIPATTHAAAGAPFATTLRRAPLLIFSPGGGMIRELYTAQLEDLASHGYIVAAITHSYDGFVSLFPDGTHAAYTSKRWPKTPSVEGEANLNQVEWHAADIRRVIDDLTTAQTTLPIDPTRIGAFGHSFGGIAAAHACQQDARIKACINEDGAVAFQPYFPGPRGWGMDQPFLLIERSTRTDPPTDKELEEMKMSRARVEQLVAGLHARRNRLLSASGAGSTRVVLTREGTTHMDFSDLPAKQHFLSIVNTCTREFFDHHLRGKPFHLLKAKNPDPLIETTETFAPAKRPGR